MQEYSACPEVFLIAGWFLLRDGVHPRVLGEGGATALVTESVPPLGTRGECLLADTIVGG